MKVRKAQKEDLPLILQILDDARAKMVASGNPNQWPVGYPPVETVERDLVLGVGYMVEDDGEPAGYFAMVASPDPTYARIYDGAWLDDEPYYVLHRIASKAGAHGVMAAVMEYALSVSESLRIDTHADNRIMQHNVLKYGFRYCGVIYLANGDPRLAYQLPRAASGSAR